MYQKGFTVSWDMGTWASKQGAAFSQTRINLSGMFSPDKTEPFHFTPLYVLCVLSDLVQLLVEAERVFLGRSENILQRGFPVEGQWWVFSFWTAGSDVHLPYKLRCAWEALCYRVLTPLCWGLKKRWFLLLSSHQDVESLSFVPFTYTSFFLFLSKCCCQCAPP